MNPLFRNFAVAVAGKLIDMGVAKFSGPHKATPEQRIGQIAEMLEALESEPEAGQDTARPPAGAPEVSKEAPPAPAATTTTEIMGTGPETEDIATACVPCALGHFSRSTGALEEAMRFKAQGITSNEIVDRVGGVLKEQNTLERYDLTPEKLRRSLLWEREIAEEALVESRRVRHVLEGLESIEQLEVVAAETAAFYEETAGGDTGA